MRNRIAVLGLALALFGIVLSAQGQDASLGERVCLATATETLLPYRATWRARVVQNQGPNLILCTRGPQLDGGNGAAAGYAIELAAEVGIYQFSGNAPVYCRATSADQTAPNCTAVQGVP